MSHLPQPAPLLLAAPATPAVEIELLENGILGAPRSCGRLVLPLRQLVAGGKVSGERRLEGEGTSAKVQLDAAFKYYF